MRSVVIGGSGFLGAAVAQELMERGREVVVFDICGSQTETDARLGTSAARFVAGDILDAAALRDVLSGAHEAYHFAGKLGTSELDDDAEAATLVNVLGSIRVFEAAIERQVPRVFHASKPNVWTNAYTITKHAAERFAELFGAAQSGTIFRSLRYFNAYGPGQALGPVRKLVPSLTAQALAGKPLEIFGDGNQIVDLIYVDDLARLTVDYMWADQGAGAPDCGRGVPITVNDVAAAINAEVANQAGLVHLPMRRGEPESTVLVADTSSLRDSLGGLSFSDWSQTIADTVAWYARHGVSSEPDQLVAAQAVE